MMNDGWGGVGEWFEMSPHPGKLVDGGSVLIGRGEYVGTSISSYSIVSTITLWFV